MFVCVCNAIRESQVREARDQGCRTAEEVMVRLGAKLECRACVGDLLRALAAQERAEEGVVAGLRAS